MNELHKFVLNLSQRLDLRSLNEHAALQNLSITPGKNKTTVQKQETRNNSCKNLNCLMVPIQCWIMKLITL